MAAEAAALAAHRTCDCASCLFLSLVSVPLLFLSFALFSTALFPLRPLRRRALYSRYGPEEGRRSARQGTERRRQACTGHVPRQCGWPQVGFEHAIYLARVRACPGTTLVNQRVARGIVGRACDCGGPVAERAAGGTARRFRSVAVAGAAGCVALCTGKAARVLRPAREPPVPRSRSQQAQVTLWQRSCGCCGWVWRRRGRQ